MKCGYILCFKTHKAGYRLLKDSNGQFKCWEHLSKDEQDQYMRHYNETVPPHRRAMTQKEVNESEIWW